MGRSPCCEKVGLKKGPWTPQEDQKLKAYIEEHGHVNWTVLPAKAGIPRCGKSCRLRWKNYLRPDIKRGEFSLKEENTIIQLHALLGNKWSTIANHLPKRTDNEIKNYWNTHLKKRLTKMGIDPETHKPKIHSLCLDRKDTANLSHISQWESVRLEAEARLSNNSTQPKPLMQPVDKAPEEAPPTCLDVLKPWERLYSMAKGESHSTNSGMMASENFVSPISLVDFSNPVSMENVGFGHFETTSVTLDNNSTNYQIKPVVDQFQDCAALDQDNILGSTSAWFGNERVTTSPTLSNFIREFTGDIPLNNFENNSCNIDVGGGNRIFEEEKNNWDSLLDLVGAVSPSVSPFFWQF